MKKEELAGNEPSKIWVNEASTDPMVVMQYGFTVHGGMEISCPFISHIKDNLYVGGVVRGMMLPREIEYIISMYVSESYMWHENVKDFRFYEMRDSTNQSLSWIGEPVEVLLDFLSKGKTLIHCQAGLNRSGLVAALALCRLGMKPQEAIDLLRSKRSPAVLCNKAFEAHVLANGGTGAS